MFSWLNYKPNKAFVDKKITKKWKYIKITHSNIKKYYYNWSSMRGFSMGTDFYVAQGISILTAIVAIMSMQLKSMKGILISQIIANLLASSTYFVLGSFSGAGISLIAIIQLVVVYIYDKKNVKPHL